VVVGSFDVLAVDEPGASATSCGAFTARHRAWADSISLNAIASPAAREPGPLVTLVRCRTVAKVDSIGFVVRKLDPMLGRKVIERQQLLDIISDLRDCLRELAAVQRS
jgi:hypothetical protein